MAARRRPVQTGRLKLNTHVNLTSLCSSHEAVQVHDIVPAPQIHMSRRRRTGQRAMSALSGSLRGE